MKKKKIIWALLAIFGIPALLIYLSISNSTDCSQFVIDTYELHSGIDIPEVNVVNCYYDEESNTRISVYDLNASIDLSKFGHSDFASTEFLKGKNLLSKLERPTEKHLFLASGEKWGTKWTYVVDSKSKRLWAELNF